MNGAALAIFNIDSQVTCCSSFENKKKNLNLKLKEYFRKKFHERKKAHLTHRTSDDFGSCRHCFLPFKTVKYIDLMRGELPLRESIVLHAFK